MGRPIRYFKPGSIVEITCRAVQRRYLLRPSEELNELVVGVLGKAMEYYPVRLIAIHVMSNHIHMLVWIPDSVTQSEFMCFFKGNLAKEVGRLHSWEESVWSKRFSAAAVLDDEALGERIEDVLEQGCKEGLINRPCQWPGVNSVKAVLEGEPLRGTWFDRTAESRARRRGERIGRYDYATRYEIHLMSPPFLADKTVDEQRAWFRRVIRRIERRTRQMHRKNGSRALGVARIRNQDPHGRPGRRPERRPAPVCHAADVAVWGDYRDELRGVRDDYTRASRRWRRGAARVRFPRYTFPPPAWSARALVRGQPP